MLNKLQLFFSFTYLYHSSSYIVKWIPFLVIITILDFFPIYTNINQSARHLYNFIANDPSGEIDILPIDKFYSYVSILPLFKSLMTCKSNEVNVNQLKQKIEACFISFYILIPIFVLLLVLIIINILSSKTILKNRAQKETEKEKRYHDIQMKNIFFHIIFNFFDYFYFRVLSLFILFILSNYVIYSIQFTKSIGLMIVSLVSMSIIVYICTCYFLINFVYSQLGYFYPFDYFTMQYELLLLFLKIMIALENNMNIFNTEHASVSNILGLFFPLLGICALVVFIIYHISKFLINSEHIIYYSNENCNLFRLSLLLLTLFSIMFQIIFHIDNVVINISALVSLIGLTLLIVLLIKKKRMIKIYKGNAINQLLFLIDHYSLIKGENDNKPIPHWNTDTNITPNQYMIQQFNRNIFINHLNHCSNKSNECSLCKIFHSPIIDDYELFFERLFNGLYGQYIYQKQNRSNWNMTDLFGWQNEIVQFIHQMISLKENYYLFSYYIVNVLNRLETNSSIKNNNVMCVNILAYYKKKLMGLDTLIGKVNMLLSIEEQSDIINEILDEWEKALFIKVLNPFNLITSSLKMNRLYKKVIAIINMNENKNNYHSVIIKYILEKLLKTKLKHGGAYFDITSFDEMLNDCYLNNKHMTLKFDLKIQHITILSAGREFFRYKNKPFKDIFLAQYDDLGLEKFKESIKETDFQGEFRLFQFPIKDFDNPQYLLLFRLKYAILPTINIKECLIFGLYQLRREALLLTMTNYETDENNNIYNNSIYNQKIKKEERLITYSYPMIKNLIITMDLMEVMNKNKYTIDIHQLFSTNSDKSTIVFNYQKYCDFLDKIITQLFRNNELLQMKSDNANSKLSKYEEIKNQIEAYKTKIKENKLKGKAEFDFPAEGIKLILYSLERENDTHGAYNIDNTYNDDINNDLDFSTFIYLGTGTGGTNNLTANSSANNSSFLDNSTSSQIGNRSTRSSKNAFNYKFKADLKEKKRQSRNFNLFTFFILGSNLILIVLTIGFLFTQLDKTNKFIAILDLFMLWSQLIKLFFNTNLNIFFNLCIGIKGEINCENYFQQYEKIFVAENNLPTDFSIQTYITNELVVKADTLRTLLSDVSTHIYQLNEETIIDEAESTFRFRYLSVVEKTLEVKEDVYPFLNALKVYLNLINMIMENDDYSTKPIYILNISGPKISDIILENINLDAPLTQNQIIGYNIIINFPLYITTFFDLNQIIFGLLLRNIDICKIVVISFSIAIIAIHFLFMILCFWFTYFFRQNLQIKFEDIHKKLSDPLTKDSLKEKYISLKTLAGFYNQNPNDIIAKFMTEENSRIKEMKESSKPNHNISNENNNQQSLPKAKSLTKSLYSNDSYKRVLQQSLTLLYLLFSAYFIYSIIFISLLIMYLSDFALLINIFGDNITLDIYLASLTGLLQVTLMTNQTEDQLAEYLNQTVVNTEGGFSQAFISASYSYLFTILTEEKRDLIPLLKSIDCFAFYKDIEDSLLIEVNDRFNSFDYSRIIPYVCNAYPFMKENNSKIVITEILYRSTKLLNSIEYTYEKLYEINNSYEMFDMYLILIIIFRPMRNYETITLFNEAISNLTYKNNLITYIYLFCNIVIEIILFFAIKEYVIKKYKLMNKSMTQMNNSITW